MKHLRFAALIIFMLLAPAYADRVPLGVESAIARALDTNLKARLAKEKVIEAEATLQAAWTAYNPRFGLNLAQYNRSVNLAELGLVNSGLPTPTRIGPFFTFETNLTMVYRLIDSARSWGMKAQQVETELSKLQADFESKTVTVLTSGTYVLLLEAIEKEDVSRAEVDLAERLERQADNLEKAGVAAGIDLTRAQTRLAQRRLQLTLDQRSTQDLERQLLRLTGLPLTDELELQDNLLHIPNPYPGVKETIALARDARTEIALAHQQLALSENRFHQTQAQSAPTLDVVGSAGIGGNTPFENSTFIHNVGLSLSWPIFDGGLTQAQATAAQSRITQAKMQLDDAIVQVELDVRDAYAALDTAASSILTAQQAVDLAQQELTMSDDRFQVGLTNNVELLASQEALTNARYSAHQALASYNLSLIRLASASGRPDILLGAFHKAQMKGYPRD